MHGKEVTLSRLHAFWKLQPKAAWTSFLEQARKAVRDFQFPDKRPKLLAELDDELAQLQRTVEQRKVLSMTEQMRECYPK